ncbi:hypothetical protein IFR05_009627 [Cadophora sp. M221]|nr:hypothetical protein IFR05_009627 [Cadophora sp. M221]
MDAALLSIGLATLNWALPPVTLPWTDIAFVIGLIYLYGRILCWMQRDDEFLHIDEIVAHAYLVYLVLFCCFAWVWRGMLANMGLDAAPYLKYGILMIPAMGHQAVTSWAILDWVDRSDEMAEPLKVQYAVSMIFITFCWAYLAHLE